MAGDWIKLECCTPDKPEIFQIAEDLGIDPDAVLGKLIRVWIWADTQTISGNARGVTKALLNRIAGNDDFADAVIKVGWIKGTENGLKFHNFERHNGKTAKERALTNRRVAGYRNRSCNAQNVTNSELCNGENVTLAYTREEKRREEKIKKTSTSVDVKESDNTTQPASLFDPSVYPPSILQVQEEANKIGFAMTDEEAELFVAKYTTTGWREEPRRPGGFGAPIMDWRPMVTRWKIHAPEIRANKQSKKKKPFDAADPSTWPKTVEEMING